MSPEWPIFAVRAANMVMGNSNADHLNGLYLKNYARWNIQTFTVNNRGQFTWIERKTQKVMVLKATQNQITLLTIRIFSGSNIVHTKN